jgi:hypothetical protein
MGDTTTQQPANSNPKRRALRVFAVVIGSFWFFPVSCVSSMFGLGAYAALKDRLDAEKSLTQHPLAHALVRVAPGNAALEPVYISKAPAFIKDHPDSSFILPSLEGFSGPGTGSSYYSYRVLSGNATEQVIEVNYSDGDNDVISRYRAMDRAIVPLASWRASSDRSVTFISLPIAFMIAISLLIVGKFLNQFLRREPQTK